MLKNCWRWPVINVAECVSNCTLFTATGYFLSFSAKPGSMTEGLSSSLTMRINKLSAPEASSSLVRNWLNSFCQQPYYKTVSAQSQFSLILQASPQWVRGKVSRSHIVMYNHDDDDETDYLNHQPTTRDMAGPELVFLVSPALTRELFHL